MGRLDRLPRHLLKITLLYSQERIDFFSGMR